MEEEIIGQLIFITANIKEKGDMWSKKDINAEDCIESMSDAIEWFNDFVDENERDLAFAHCEITHMSVAIVEDEDGDEEEDWDDVDEIGGKSLHWDRSDLYDEEEGDGDEISD